MQKEINAIRNLKSKVLHLEQANPMQENRMGAAGWKATSWKRSWLTAS